MGPQHHSAACFLGVLCLFSRHAVALKFIAAPVFAISPAFDVMGTAAQLQARGHQVLVVITETALPFVKAAAARYSSNTTAEAMQYVTYKFEYSFTNPSTPASAAPPQQQMGRKQDAATAAAKSKNRAAPSTVHGRPLSFLASTWFSLTGGMKLLLAFRKGTARAVAVLMHNTTAMQLLRDFQADAVMGVGLPADVLQDSLGCLLSHALGGVPNIEVNGNALMKGPPSVPQFGAGLTPADLKTLSGYTLNLATWAVQQLLLPLLLELRPSPAVGLRQQQGLPRAASRCPASNALAALRGVRSKSCHPLLEVLLSSWLVDYARPLAPDQVIVGPGSPRAPHPISPPEVAAFVEAAETDGLVLVAFGTMTEVGASLSPNDFLALVQGFADLAPVRVLWPLNQKAVPVGLTLEELPLGANTMVVPWADYNDVLGHPATRAIVSHSGLHSVNEAAFHGVPLIALPFHFEAEEQATKLAVRGAAVISPQAPCYWRGTNFGFTRQHITAIVREVLTNSSYKTAAAALSKSLKTYSARRHPHERAADEIELALYSAGVAGPDSVIVAEQSSSERTGIEVSENDHVADEL